MRARLFATLAVLCGCAPPVRFADRAILWQDPDDKPIPIPASRDPQYHWVAIRDAIFDPLDRVLALDYGRESVNVNAVDDTPNSSWWSDRRRDPGQAQPRALGEREMRRGAFLDRPNPVLPLTVVKGKEVGGNLGFIAKDALGRQFAIKLDPPGYVGLETSTEVVVSRLAWAAGWNVPAESIVDLRASDLILSPHATSGVAGKKHPLGAAQFRDLLAKAPFAPDGTLRVIASLWLEGTSIGPYTYFGRRKDDPNDRVPHEDRRDLRGYGVFSAWVNNIDTTEVNTLDTYVGEPERGHVVHWQQDVGGAFGSRANEPMYYWMGSDTYFSFSRLVGSLVTFGIAYRAWEGEAVRARRAQLVALYPELGWYDDVDFDPRRWHPVFENPAFARATARDRYWGAKQVVQLNELEVRAAIAEGRYRPAAAERLFQILWTRRERIARAYLSEVAPLDYFRVVDGRLCWDDLWITAGLGGEGGVQYLVDGRPLAVGAPRCTPVPGERGYRIVALRVRRAGERRPSPVVRVHLIDGRIVGVQR